MKKAGQLVLFHFPQTDFKNNKLRPALLLAKLPGEYDDWLVCMVSSQPHQFIEDIDEMIEIDSDDFLQSGIKSASVIRVSRLAVAADEILLGTIGEISRERLLRIKNKLVKWIQNSEN